MLTELTVCALRMILHQLKQHNMQAPVSVVRDYDWRVIERKFPSSGHKLDEGLCSNSGITKPSNHSYDYNTSLGF